jgi:aminoglycoside 3'-phosphotransferase-1
MRETACAPLDVPAGLASAVDGYAWARDAVGESGGGVYRLYGHRTAPDLFLKHGDGTVADDITDEMARLHWLADHVSVPTVRHFIRTPDEAWLLTTALEGRTAYQILSDQPSAGPAVVTALADCLHRWHAIPVEACPFNSDHLLRLHQARARIAAGLVDTDDFDDERLGWTAEQVWLALQDLLPLTPDPVVTHGDFSLDNILIRDGAVVGCIDVGRAGVADRYQDLAILWNSLAEFGSEIQEQLFASYGNAAPDARKLPFHLLLDEFF